LIRVFKGKTLKIYQLNSGKFSLDGGAMFGIVPKVIWENLIQPDGRNRIPMATHPLLVETEKGYILIESGLGIGWDEKFKDIYAVEEEDPFKGVPVGREEVSLIIQTHLHFDHAGELVLNGEYRYKCPVVVQQFEWMDALFPHERSRASYPQERILPLERFVRLVSGTQEVWENVFVYRTGGHTRGHQVIFIKDSDKLFVFMGDVIPTRHHAPLPYVMGYDLYPEEMLFVRKSLYPYLMQEKAIIFTPHDREGFAGYLKLDEKGKFFLEEVEPDDVINGS
jgi:glyoxylase-like metal-dependent hydrolase (beta-lactamase superfamily II)